MEMTSDFHMEKKLWCV